MTPENKARERSEQMPVASERDTPRSRRAEEALRESEARLRLSMKAANVGLWDWNLETHAVYYSPEWKMQLGYRDEEISHHFDEWKSRVHPEDLAPALGKVAAYLENPQHRYEIEIRMRHRDGSYRWIYTQADLVRDAAGKAVRMLGSHIDITDRKRAEESLRESEERNRILSEAAFEGIAISENGVMLDCNDQLARMIGRQRSELIGRRITELVAPTYRNLVAEALDSGHTDPYENALLRADGTLCPVMTRARYAQVGGRQVRITAVQDNTERQNAEASLRESEARYRQIVDTAEEGIWMIDARQMTSFVNPKMARLLGYTVEEMVGRELHCFMDEEGRAITDENVRRRKQGVAEQHDFKFLRKDGSALWAVLSTNPIYGADDAYAGALAMLTDITERKQAEAALRESEEFSQRIIDSSQDCIKVLDLEGNLLSMSVGGQRLLEIEDVAALLNKSWVEIWKNEDEIAAGLAVAKARAGGVGEFSGYCATAKGTPKWWEIIVTPIRDAHENVTRLLAVSRDITQRKQAEDELHRLSHRLLRAEDAERRRIAKELHDATAQDLVAVTMNLGTLQELIAPGDSRAARILEDSIALVENSVNDIRTLSYVLHPPRLDEMGLAGALAEYAAGFTTRTDTRIRVEVAPDFRRLSEDIEIVLFRVVQEGIANVLRHAQSDAATIRLAHRAGSVVLEIEDYGRGMAGASAHGVGIVGMRERLQQLGGRFEIESDSGGTIIRAMLPLPDNPK